MSEQLERENARLRAALFDELETIPVCGPPDSLCDGDCERMRRRRKLEALLGGPGVTSRAGFLRDYTGELRGNRP